MPFAALTTGSLLATRVQTAIGDRQFVYSMIPHHSGAILMCWEANLTDPEPIGLCTRIRDEQREEIHQMERIRARLK